MGSVRQQRGRLPQRVYWVRRSVVLGVALLLVFGITRLIGGIGEDDPDSSIKASTTSAEQKAPSASVTLGPVAPSEKIRLRANAPLAPSSGECRDDDISVRPTVPRAWAGGPIVIRLQLSGTQPACTFKVASESLVVKIASGEDRIWSSQDCPQTIQEREVVVRSAVPVEVPVTWNGRRSDDQCTPGLDWALPGFYHVFAAALGSAPTDVQFEVTQAPTRTVTRTAKPKPSVTTPPKSESTPAAKSSPSAQSSTKATVPGEGSKCGGDNVASSC
jgi:hypothetical protein